MIIKAVKLTLLNHLFYYTEVSGGSTSASSTGQFIGDLALTYALYKTTVESSNYYRHLKRPNYKEIKDFGFYCTVAKPVSGERTENYIQNTLFNSDGYFDISSITKSGKSPYKNFRQVQGMGIGAEFKMLILSSKDFDLPPCMRVGTGRGTLLKVEEIEPKESDRYWLNAFTLKTVFDELEEVTKILVEEEKVNFSFILENYTFIKELNLNNIQRIFKNHF